MAGERRALIIATGEYEDPKLARLRAPDADADRLAEVLRNPDIGGFEVEVARDEDGRSLGRRLADFFKERRLDDLVLVHISCHGIKDDRGRLFLAARDTEIDYPDLTAVSSDWLNDLMTRTRARRSLLLLDCCFAGRFPFGMRRRSGEDVGIGDHLGGRGAAVISASTAMEYAYEGDQLDHLSGEAQGSVFTTALVDGLESGEADRDHDKWISVDELYDYVYDRVKAENPAQKPTRQGALEGDFYVARSVYEPPVEPAEVDPQLTALIESPLAGARLGAVEELAPLLTDADPARALAARQRLEGMRDDDSRRVSERAKAVLAESSPEASEPPPPAAPAVDWSAGAHQVTSVGIKGRDTPDAGWVAFSPDGRQLATAGSNNTARVWELPGGRELIRVTHGAGVRSGAFSPDGRQLATAGADKTARVWDLIGGHELIQITHADWVWGVAFSPDGRKLATASDDQTARVWELIGGRELTRLPHESFLRGVAFSPDGRQLATAGADNTARVWDLIGEQELIRITHKNWVWGVAFSPDGREFATASTDCSARVWELAGGRELVRVTHSRAVRGVAFSPDGRRIATASTDNSARVWEIPGGRELVKIAHDHWVRGVAFSPDGRQLATASDDKRSPVSARVWESRKPGEGGQNPPSPS